jgi:biopolymer transport protein ExbB
MREEADELPPMLTADLRAAAQARLELRLDRIEAGALRRLRSGAGLLASIGSVGPFVGLFGTVFGIMNSFVAIAATKTTNLSVVAPGIAEALLATGIGLVAAIPAVLLYNALLRRVAAFRHALADARTDLLLRFSREMDLRMGRA